MSLKKLFVCSTEELIVSERRPVQTCLEETEEDEFRIPFSSLEQQPTVIEAPSEQTCPENEKKNPIYIHEIN